MTVASVPFNYPLTVFDYTPSKAGAIIVGVVLVILSISVLVRLYRKRNWWGLCLPIGILLYAIGFFVRLASVNNPSSRGLFATSQVLIIASPGAFLAFNYIVYGRLIRTFAAGQSQYSLMRPQIVASVFITSDIVTFIVQGAGAALSTSPDTLQTGRNVVLIGVAAQTASYAIFCVLLVHSHVKFAKDGKSNSSNFPWALFYVLYFSSIFITVRAVYRLVEFIQGHGGYLITHEVFFYCLDTVPLFLATSIHALFWPGNLIEAYRNSDYVAVRLAKMDRQGVLLRPCTTALRAYVISRKTLFSSATRGSTPWFVDQEFVKAGHPPPHLSSEPSLAEQEKSLPPDLPAYLAALYSELTKSPHLERGGVEVCSPPPTEPGPPLPSSLPKGRRQRGRTEFGLGISDASGGLWRWILIAQVKEGTENRGAIESVMRIVRRTLLKAQPSVVLPSNRKRRVQDGWGMLDAGDFAVHVLSRSAREKFFPPSSEVRRWQW
ncbi:hypothetical protein ACEPAH_5100 [Sanghuangporus vaninii]